MKPLRMLMTTLPVLMTLTGSAFAQTAKDLVGAWTIVSATVRQGGKKLDLFGPSPKGSLVLAANGRYAVVVARAGIAKIASNNPQTGTPEEYKAIAQGSLAHFGSYTVDEAGKALTFRVETSTYPNWDGTEQKRVFTLKGDELRYVSQAPPTGGTVAEVVLRRSK